VSRGFHNSKLELHVASYLVSAGWPGNVRLVTCWKWN
jgi:hypothetical protein